MDAILQVLAMLCAALFAGAALYISIVEHPARLKTGVPTATEGFRHMYKLAAPWQASLAVVSLLAGLAVGVRRDRGRRSDPVYAHGHDANKSLAPWRSAAQRGRGARAPETLGRVTLG